MLKIRKLVKKRIDEEVEELNIDERVQAMNAEDDGNDNGDVQNENIESSYVIIIIN